MRAKKTMPKDSDLAGATEAIIRAAKSARVIAQKTKTPCYVMKDGKIVDLTKGAKKTTKSRRAPG